MSTTPPPVGKLKVETVPVERLSTHPRNARHGDVGAIAASLTEFGQFRPLVVQRSTGHIIAGNHTYRALTANGVKHAQVTYLDVDDETALRILIADNRTSDLATNDLDALMDILSELHADGKLTGTGYDGDDLDDLLRDLEQSAPVPDVHEYTQAIVSPVYEPTMDAPPPVEALMDTAARDALLEGIQAAGDRIPDDVAVFLACAADRHVRFDYQAIAEFYAHAPADVQRLMEASALIIIDYEQAVERGFVRLNAAIQDAFHEDYPDA